MPDGHGPAISQVTTMDDQFGTHTVDIHGDIDIARFQSTSRVGAKDEDALNQLQWPSHSSRSSVARSRFIRAPPISRLEYHQNELGYVSLHPFPGGVAGVAHSPVGVEAVVGAARRMQQVKVLLLLVLG
jgi:hypothetical protein